MQVPGDAGPGASRRGNGKRSGKHFGRLASSRGGCGLPRVHDTVPVMDDFDTVIPVRYAELARLAWNRDPSRPITGEEAFGLYEANWRHIEVASLSDRERALIKALADRFGGGHLLTTK